MIIDLDNIFINGYHNFIINTPYNFNKLFKLLTASTIITTF